MQEVLIDLVNTIILPANETNMEIKTLKPSLDPRQKGHVTGNL